MDIEIVGSLKDFLGDLDIETAQRYYYDQILRELKGNLVEDFKRKCMEWESEKHLRPLSLTPEQGEVK